MTPSDSIEDFFRANGTEGQDLGPDLGKDLGQDLGQDLGEDLGQDLGQNLGQDLFHHLPSLQPQSALFPPTTMAMPTTTA